MWVKQVNNVDLLIGRRIRHGRWVAGVSQSELASSIQTDIGVLQKYEMGTERVPPSTLMKIARTLDVPAGFFFSNAHEERKNPALEFLEVLAASGKNIPSEDHLSRLLAQTDQK